jgi:(p)ppGpp synthase/HD superfamily hydrolase
MDEPRDENRIENAKDWCKIYHEGQFRKGNNEPYHTHPFAVADILSRNLYTDTVSQCVAFLHDALECVKKDGEELTEAQMNIIAGQRVRQIESLFGYEISNGVYNLSRNKGKMEDGERLSRDQYMQRLFWQRDRYRRVKIADSIDNTSDLETLDEEGRERIITDSVGFYIPWGKEIAPVMVRELITNINEYFERMGMPQRVE